MGDAALRWADAPGMDARDFHDVGGQRWRYDSRGVFIERDSGGPLRSPGDPKTVTAILADYGTEIFEASLAHRVPPELIVMTIATETAAFRDVGFTGPRTFRWEARVGSYSAGPMQVLESTARDVIARLRLSLPPPPRFPVKPAPPASNPLYNGEVNIPLGTGLIRLNSARTGLDPIFVAAAYNAGSLQHTTPTAPNPWGLVSTGDHLNRAAEWFGDACAVLAPLRSGTALDVAPIITPPRVDPEDQEPIREFALRNLTSEEADEQTKEFEDSGATIIRIPEEGGFVTLIVVYRRAVAVPPTKPPPAPGPAGRIENAVSPPSQDGYVICIDRKSTQKRAGKAFRRTVGLYQAFIDRKPIPDVCGTAVERQGPGDNTNDGVARHARIEAGTYPLLTHAGGSNKYRTFGYANPGGIRLRPWPSIRVGNTTARTGILIHCAAGYLMSIGCINLTSGRLSTAGEDIEFFDSRMHLIKLIQSMQAHLGDFPSSNNATIRNAFLVLRGEP